MQKIYFGTKEEHNARREAEFLALSGAERFDAFLKLCSNLTIFPSSVKGEHKGNLILKKKDCGF